VLESDGYNKFYKDLYHLKVKNKGAYDIQIPQKIIDFYSSIGKFIFNNIYKSEDGDRRVKALDVGCGYGHLTNIINEQFNVDITGIELSNEAADYCRSAYGINVLQVDANNISVETLSRYDLVIASAVLEHTFNPKEFLLSVSRVLMHDGYLFVRVPGLDSLNTKLFFLRFDKIFKPVHTYYFTQNTLAALLSKCGFIVIAKKVVNKTNKSNQSEIHLLAQKRNNLKVLSTRNWIFTAMYVWWKVKFSPVLIIRSKVKNILPDIIVQKLSK
jgi:2-polyprenyl-3-methyl-5-hydroxy-6-metoxy-1,4-benzoquinol methylase